MIPSLHLPNACLTQIPSVSTLPLINVNLEGNRLSNLDGLPMSVEILNASSNKLEQEGLFVPFPSLKILLASHNALNIFDEDDFVLCFPSLTDLDLSHNRLRNTGFLRESLVEHLNVSHNRLAVLTGLPSTLQSLIAHTNEITMVQSKLPPLIEQIDLGYNSLRYAGLSFKWPSTLRELHLNHNRIEKFPRKLPDSLEVLSLAHNELTELPPSLPQSLKVCNVNHNRIHHLPTYKKRMSIFLINENCLTEEPDGSFASVFEAEDNWNTTEHHKAQQTIRVCWKRYVFTLRLRHLKRTHVVREELFQVSMMPERWQQIDTISPEWSLRRT